VSGWVCGLKIGHFAKFSDGGWEILSSFSVGAGPEVLHGFRRKLRCGGTYLGE
jgi:hypothetical protein